MHSTAASDVSGDVDDTSSYNLIGSDLELTGISHGFQGNLIGTANAPLDARLDALQDNGGPTWTHGLQTGSPAIDAGQLGDAQGVDQTQDLSDRRMAMVTALHNRILA